MSQINWNDFTPVDENGAPTKPAQQKQAVNWDDFTPAPEPAGVMRKVGDLGISLAKGVVGVPEAAVGLLDIPTGGAVGKFLENEGGAFGFRPKQAKEYLSSFQSDDLQAKQKQFQDADGVLNKAGVAISNPSLIVNAITESAPSIGAGGVVSRGLMAAGARGVSSAAGGVGPALPGVLARTVGEKAAPRVAGALGEGVVGAGSAAESIRQETQDGLLTPTQSALAAGSGLATAVFGYLGGKAAERLGIGDLETMIAKGAAGQAPREVAKSIPRQVIEGAISEGLLEELPQSVSEQVLQNLALNKPWHEGVEDAAVMGTLAGMAMGGGAAGYSGLRTENKEPPPEPPPAPTQNPAPGQPPASGPTLALPAPDPGVIQVGADSTARTPPYQVPPYVGDVTDVEPKPVNPVREQVAAAAEQGGALSAAALTAIDAGVTESANPGYREIDFEDADPHDQATVLQFFKELDAERAAASYFDGNDDDIPDFGAPSNATTEQFLRAMGASDEEIQDAVATSRKRANAQSNPSSNVAAPAYEPADPRQSVGASASRSETQVAPRQPDNFTGTPAAAMGQPGATVSAGPGFGLKDALAQIRERKQQEASGAQAAQAATAPAAQAVPAARSGAVEAAGVDRSKLLASLDQRTATREQVLRVRLDDAQRRLNEAIAYPNINRFDQAANVEELKQEIASLNDVRAQARELDDRDLRDGITRSMLRGARQELDAAVRAGAMTPEAAQAIASGAEKTGNAADAIMAIFNAVDSSVDSSVGAAALAGPAPDIKAITGKLIPDMTDAELQVAIEHYGPAHKRTAKLQKEVQRRAAPAATTIPGVTNGPQAPQAEQASPQPAQAGAAPAAGPATGNASAADPTGTPEVRALTNGAQAQNTGAQAAPAAGPQGATASTQAPDLNEVGARWTRMTSLEREGALKLAGWRTNAGGLNVVGKRLLRTSWGNMVAGTQDTLARAMSSGASAETVPERLGIDNTPLSEGGKPFKTRKSAADAKKRQPMMRVVQVEGGFALAEKTPAQLAAEERAAKRLSQPRTSPKGEPVPAHAFIAAAGGLHLRHRNDLGVDGNPRIGNRSLFGGLTKGLSIEQATEMLVADGYLPEGASHNDAYALIKKSLSRPQYNADGIERIAESERDAQFEDYLAAQEDAAQAGDGFNPFDLPPELTPEDLAAEGYTQAGPALQAEVDALIAQAEAIGIDTRFILDDIERIYANASQDEYNAAARKALAAAIARSNQDRSGASAETAPTTQSGGAEQGLTSPTRADIEAQQDRTKTAAARDQREQVRKESEAGAGQFQLTQEDGRQDASGDIFGTQADQAPSEQAQPASAPSDSVVNVPPAIAAALDADMQAQKARVTRLRNEAAKDGTTLEEKTRAQTQLKGAEFTLQTMRRTRFDAEDAAIKAIEQKDMALFAEHITFFKTEKALQELIGAAQAPAPAAAPKKVANQSPQDFTQATDSGLDYADGQQLGAQDLLAYFDKVIAGSQKGERIVNPRFQIGEVDDGTAQEIARFINGYDGNQRRLRVSGRTIKHIHESRPAIAREIVGQLPGMFSKPDEVLPDPKHLSRRALLVKERTAQESQSKQKSYVATVEVEIEVEVRDGFIDIVTIMTAPDRSLREARELKKNWPEGQQRTEQAVNSPHPLTAEAANPEADFPDAQPAAGSVPPAATPAQPDTPKLTPAQAKALMEWQDMGQRDGIKTHALWFYESQADKDAKRGRMMVAKVSKEVDGGNWLVYGADEGIANERIAVLGMAKKKAEEVGMAKAVADGYVEQAAANAEPAKATARSNATIEDAGQKIGGARNDRNAFTLQRLNRDTGKMEPVTFERGEYVRHKLGYGEIEGISQARSEFSADGVWQPFGFAYKADRPAAPKTDAVPLSSVIDKVNAKNGQGLTDADRVPEQKPASKTPTMDRHNATMAAVREGKATAEQFRASFEQVVGGKAAIVAELDTMTKVQLLREGGPFVQMRYANEKKADVVDAMYRDMVGEYALGESVTYSMGKGAFEAAMRKMVEATDAEKLSNYVTERKAAMEEMQARRAAKAAAIENPQTLGDFREVLNAKIRDGMTRKEAFLALTPEQRIQYDTLEAEFTREAREARKRAQKAEVRAAGQTTAGEIVATKHTRDGYDLFVVKLADRLGADDYKTVLTSAKKLGGWYSAFRGNGAIPGFQFKDKANADAFLALAGGDTTSAQERVTQRRDAFEDDRSQTAVERLRSMADKLEESAAEVEGQQRKTNTERRARFAIAALQAAAADKAKAQTMRNIAQAIEAGNAKFLDAVRTKSQVDLLTGIVETAKGAELRAKYPSYADQQKRKGEPPTAETADFADFPSYTVFRSDLATLGRQMLEVDGTKKMGQRLMSVADDVTDSYLEFAKANFLAVSQFGRGDSLADFVSKEGAERAIKRSGLTGKAIVLPIKRGQNRVILSPSEAIGRGMWKGDGDKRITLTAEFGAELVDAIGRRGNKQNQLSVPWQFQTAYDRRKALSRIGIETPSEFRSALREFIALKEQATAHRTRTMELQMVGRKADGLDFFPTSAEVADQMVEAADLSPDMAVLEPSAGMGHLADRIREAGAEPDVIEISADRRELLEEKGYHLAEHSDFLQMEPRKFFTYGDLFRAPDGKEGTMRGVGRMGSQRVRLEDEQGNRIGLYDRSELVGIGQRGSWSGYDRIIMNPPFSNRRDAEHVRHAYSLLKPGGRIVALMGEGVFFGQDKKAQDFRDWLESVDGTSEKLPEGSFMDPSLPVNTGVNARMVVIDKPDDASFSRTPSGMTPEQAVAALYAQSPVLTAAQRRQSDERMAETQSLVDDLKKNWVKAPKIIFARNMNDPQVPQAVRDYDAKLKSQGSEGEARGFIHKGTVYLLSDQLQGPQQIAETLFHEVLGHYGLRGAFGDGLKAILQQMGTMRRRDVLAKAREYGMADKSLDDAQAWAAMSEKVRLDAAEEVLAEMAQSTPEIGFVQRAIAAIRTWLRANVPGFKNLALTDAEIVRSYILPARGFVTRSSQTPQQSLQRSLMPAFGRGSNDGTSENDADLKAVEQAYGGRPAWEKAKAEGKTKLTYGQWLQVRTPKFKAWFGDWELVALERSMRRVRGSNQVQAIRGEIVDRPIVNMESGIVATVSNSSLGKMMSQSNVERSVSSQAHMQALGNIDRLFRLARLDETRNPKKATDVGDIAAIHHFEVPMPFDGEMLRVRMMGKQFIDPAKGTRLYLLEALEIEKAGVKGGDPEVSGQFQYGTAATSPPAPGSRAIFSQMVSAINGDGVSKAIDPQTGEPMAVYHGTAADVEFFDPLALGANTHAQSAKGGFFFAASPKVASGYAILSETRPGLRNKILANAANSDVLSPDLKQMLREASESFTWEDFRNGEPIGDMTPGANVLSVYASIKNPLIVDHKGESYTERSFANWIKEAKEAGNDGVIFRNAEDAYHKDFAEPTDIHVAFTSTQIKSATGNNGNFDPEDRRINFSRSKLADLKNGALDRINQAMSYPGKVSLWDKTVGTMRHLAERAPAFKPVFEAAQRFIDDVSTLANEAADAAPRLLPRIESLSDLKKKPISAEDNKAIARPLFEGTLLWGRDSDGKAVLVDDLEKKYANLPADDKAQMMLRTGRLDAGVLRMWRGLPLDQYESAINTRFQNSILKPGVVWTEQELQSLFNATPKQISLYQEARAAIDRSIDLTVRADMLRLLGAEYAPMRDAVMDAPLMTDALTLLVDTLEREAQDAPDQRDRLAGLMHQLRSRHDKAQELIAAGYAPLSRFGRHTVDVVDANGERQYFGMFESAREANLMAMKMRDQYKGATVKQGTKSQEEYKLLSGITPESLELFGNMLGLDAEGDNARDKAFQDYLKLTKNNHSALKRLIHRKGIAGYSEDVGRVLASFVYSNARQAAGGLNVGTMETAISKIPQGQGELKDVAMGLREYIRDPQEEGQAIRGMLFAQYLGGSVASAFVNMTQPFAVTMPYLSQFGGMKKAAAQMARAVKDIGNKTFKGEPDLARALHQAVEDGTVAPQEIHMLMAQARGTGSLRVGDGTKVGDARAAAANNWERVKVAWGQPFALAEQFNRRATFIAAFRMAKEQDNPNPAEFARKAVLETQFLYSKANKAQWARGAVGGTLMTFKTYSVSYLELLQRTWNAGKPGSPERAAGRRAVAWAVVMLLLMGGAGGLPFAEDLEDLIDGAGQLMGYNMNSKQWRKELMREVLGQELGDFVNTGVSGLPGAPIDVSGRLGMGNLIPGTGLLLSKQNRERDLLEIAGPAGDLVSRGFTGARKLLTGDLGGAALEVSPSAVRNAAKGIDMASSGIYKDDKGYKVLDTTLPEAAAKFIGFQPRSVAKVQEANSFMLRSKAFYAQTSSEIKAEWAKALFEKDEAGVQRARERVAEWNRDNPDQRMTVQMPDIWKRVREMGKDRTQRIADTAPKALRDQMRQEVQRVREPT